MNSSCHDLHVQINYLSDLAPHEISWDEHRSNAQTVQTLYEYSEEFNKYAERISSCSGILKFGFGESKLILKQAFFCRVRYCPVCQWRRSLLWRAVMFQKLDEIKKTYPTHRWVFLTLTVRNCDVVDLKETLDHMNASWQRLIQTKAFKSGIAGFLRTTEVTRGNDGAMRAHPHFHALLLVKPTYFSGKNYIKQNDWVEMWQKALRVDYLPSVNVKAVKAFSNNQLDKAICETLKYSVKPSDLALESDFGAWLQEMTRQTHKKRFIASGGVLKGVLKPEDKITQSEMLTSSETPEETDERRIAFQYAPIHKRYVYQPRFNE
ncbi:protein rep [Acinetobacter baumannii]|uniref:protein rep n=1 Tax=Acinetobacter baumannii TaxID=470 RepID=UPI003A83A6D5